MKAKLGRPILFGLFGAAVSVASVAVLNITGFFDGQKASFSHDIQSKKADKLSLTESLSYDLQSLVVKSGDNLFTLLRKKIDLKSVNVIISEFKNLRKPHQLKVGDEFVFYVSNHNHKGPDIVRVDWKYSKDERIVARLTKKIEGDLVSMSTSTQKQEEFGWSAEVLKDSYRTNYVSYEGTVEGSFWHSGKQSGLPDSHIVAMANLFAWEIDFSREVRAGDKWKMVVEQRELEGKKSTLGKIVATQYESKNSKAVAVRWIGDSNVESGYFQPNGESLRRMFLKAPIDFARISSRFNMARFHPILKVRKPHLGVDYAARIGTPVKSIGSGRVIYRGYSAVAGNTLKIRHNSTYTTAYKHLNGFARGIKKGSVVEQGQVVAYVGTTGRSTGPHLHFELKKDGRIIDPLSETFPTADPFPAKYMATFKEKTAPFLELLNGSSVISKNEIPVTKTMK